MLEMSNHEKLLGVGVVVGAALLVLFMRTRANASNGSSVGGANDLVAGYTTASTLYVPTTSETYNYVTNNGTMDTITQGGNTTTLYAPVPTLDAPPPMITAHPIKAPQYTSYDATGKPIKSWTSVSGLVDTLSGSPSGTIKDSKGTVLYTEPKPAVFTAYDSKGNKIQSWSSASGLVGLVNKQKGAYILDAYGNRQYTSRA